MNIIDQAYETQLKNIQLKTGKLLEELYGIIRSSGLSRHGEIRDLLKRDLGLGHGDANTLTHFFLNAAERTPQGTEIAKEDILAEIYAGQKALLRPLHDRMMAVIEQFGPFEIAPKKGYISLRRKKQFAMIGPASRGRVEVGLNMKGVDPGERLIALPPGGMCQYKVFISEIADVDGELIAWVKIAYEAAG